MEIDNKTAKKVLIRAIQRQGVDADNLMNKRSPTQWQDFPKKADKLLKSSTARVRLEANIKKRGLTTPNQGYKGYSGKLDTKKSDIVKDIKKFRTMGNIKKLTPVGLVTAIMQPKKVGDATLKKTINRNPNFPR